MAYGKKNSGSLRKLKAAVADAGKSGFGFELRDRTRERVVKISVGTGTIGGPNANGSFDANVGSSSAEKDTGIDIPAGAVITGTFVEVLTAEVTGTTKTLDIGLLSSESGGDADGFLDGASVAATGTKTTVQGVLLTGGLWHPIASAVSVSVTAGSNNFAELSANVYVKYVELQGEL